MSKIYTIGVPIKEGCNVDGADLGISALKKEIPFDEIIDIHDVDTSYQVNMKHIETVLDCTNRLADKVYKALENSQTVITIGGDHSLAVGSVAGSSAYHNIGILWIDSHGDINNETVTLTGNVHGFPLASCIGLGPQCLNDCYQKKVKVKKENIVIFGCSDLDESEVKIAQENHLKLYRYLDIKEQLEDKILEAVTYLKTKVNGIHLSLDLDSINPHIMPAVNVKTRANIGFDLSQIYKIIDIVFDNIKVQSIDIVEYNPQNDIEQTCYREVIKLYHYIVNKIEKS